MTIKTVCSSCSQPLNVEFKSTKRYKLECVCGIVTETDDTSGKCSICSRTFTIHDGGFVENWRRQDNRR
jgi:hypothetical protein